MMQLNDILEEHSIKSMSEKTMISEENIELLLAKDFTALSKSKTLGFISIIERDYSMDLGKLKEEALAHYKTHYDGQSISLGLPMVEEKKGHSKWLFIIVLGLLAYVSWYFFTQADRQNLRTMLPFSDKKIEELTTEEKSLEEEEENVEKSLSIENALLSTQTDTTGVQTDIVEMNIEPRDANVNVQVVTVPNTPMPEVIKSITLVPKKKLWFGIIDISTGKRDHFSIAGEYEIDVQDKSWLIATSTAAFSFVDKDTIQEFNDAKEHYFKVSSLGVESLSKAEYISQGGYKKW